MQPQGLNCWPVWTRCWTAPTAMPHDSCWIVLTAAAGLPWFMGAAVQMAGQSIAFSGQRAEGCYHCLAPAASAEWGGGCAALGILGPVVGMVALQQTLDLINALSRGMASALGGVEAV